ncbi:MAG: LysM peptidoglycan-binding domain-containing protein [Granulosicoccus sp.]
MKKTTKIYHWASICLAALVIQGCATLDPSGKGTANSVDRSVMYTVKSGESLSVIAQNITGSASHWEAIAEHNAITDPRALKAGDTLEIPGDLMAQVYDISAATTLGDIQGTHSVAQASKPSLNTLTPALSTTMGVQRANDGNNWPAQTVQLHAVSVNRSFNLVPYDANSNDRPVSARYVSEPPAVRVIGTYFPKGIYEEPANYSRLMMRVTPGTVFELDSKVNDWYKIVTEQGTGYVRAADAEIVDDPSS